MEKNGKHTLPALGKASAGVLFLNYIKEQFFDYELLYILFLGSDLNEEAKWNEKKSYKNGKILERFERISVQKIENFAQILQSVIAMWEICLNFIGDCHDFLLFLQNSIF